MINTKKMMKAASLCVFFLLINLLVFSDGRLIIPRPELIIPSSISSSSRSNTSTTQVYAPTLDDPSSRAFERCSIDTYDITGPCTYDICYLYLYRSGHDGWRPSDVSVSGYNIRPITFHYDVWMPAGTWYGFNYCGRYANVDTATAIAAMK